MRKLAVFLIAFLVGCTPPKLKLEYKYRPLKYVVQNRFQPKEVVTTVDHFLFVKNLEAWKKSFPAGSIWREALLRHERVHTFRQRKYGLQKWLAKYATDKKFRWREERIANYVGLTYLKSKGAFFDIEKHAKFLSGSAYFNMVSYDEAKKFLLEVQAGTWKPDAEVPPDPE